MSELPVFSTSSMFRTINVDDPRIPLPCGKRTDELTTNELRAEMFRLGIPGTDQTSGRQVLLTHLRDYVASITVVQWPTEKQETQ